jgi:superfamily I DNA and/or RNA helicase
MNMDEKQYLVLMRNKSTGAINWDVTQSIISLNKIGEKMEVTFNGNRAYTYKRSNIKILTNPSVINLNEKILTIDGRAVDHYETALDFGEHVKLFKGDRSQLVPKSRLGMIDSVLGQPRPKAIFEYFKALSEVLTVTEDGVKVLTNQYDQINAVRKDSLLGHYLLAQPIEKNFNTESIIYPFGLNASQKKAVETALTHSISVIEGPPGTGKTQTILNIIANVVAKGKTVGMVAGNNSAMANVQEKMEKLGYEFLTAMLGSVHNREVFFKSSPKKLPSMAGWALDFDASIRKKKAMEQKSLELSTFLDAQNTLARCKGLLSNLILERSYYDRQFQSEEVDATPIRRLKRWQSDRLLRFLIMLEHHAKHEKPISFWKRIRWFFEYGIWRLNPSGVQIQQVVKSLRTFYYNCRERELQDEIQALETKLAKKGFEDLIEELIHLSLLILKHNVQKRYKSLEPIEFGAETYKIHFDEFIKRYPVVLSTTHSVMNSISKLFLFDYLIIDEASQVDLVTAALALACCKNAVIVGDVRQLPPIVTREIEALNDSLVAEKDIPRTYNFKHHSIISSLMALYQGVLPKTLLMEHYRCHPKIIGFCNEKYYDNNLVIMTDENPEDKPLWVYRTAPGNHARKAPAGNGLINIREMEVIRDEILMPHRDRYGKGRQVGVIAPYRHHVNYTKKIIGLLELEVDTIHKFQGREKETIIFSTVANQINEFVDDSNLINVAVSRAVKELIIVTSDKGFRQHGTNIGDLMRYIEYQSMGETILKSNKISVFDLLYTEHSKALLTFMTAVRNVSKFKSENLMNRVIELAIDQPRFRSFRHVLHVPLYSIVNDYSQLDETETQFAKHPWAHVDFLIYNKLDKEPVLVVEVDGYRYHADKNEQTKRDEIKDRILFKIGLPVLRIRTNESGEKDRLTEALEKVISNSA